MSSARPLRQGEFVALIAFLLATVALSIDAMLPALPDIGRALSPQDLDRAQLVITAFVFGMGLGTFFTGPLSDAYGRKPVVLAGLALYALGALMCALAPSLEMLLAARVLQGLGVAAPRTISLAIVRDLYSGRQMARIVSLSQMIFTTIPAFAPFMGLGVMLLAGWKAIFLAYLVFAALCAAWLGLRQPETLAPAHRRPLRLRPLISATGEMFSHKGTTVSILVQTLTLAMLFSTLSSIQGIFEQFLGEADRFAMWFALVALLAMSGSFINSRAVMWVGMRRMLLLTYAGMLGLSLVLLMLLALGALQGPAVLIAFVLWLIGLFAMMGTTMGNLNALAMEPLGHIAGLAASVMSSLATVGSVLLAVPVGQMFDGTPLPLIGGVTVFAALALALVRLGLPEGRD